MHEVYVGASEVYVGIRQFSGIYSLLPLWNLRAQTQAIRLLQQALVPDELSPQPRYSIDGSYMCLQCPHELPCPQLNASKSLACSFSQAYHPIPFNWVCILRVL